MTIRIADFTMFRSRRSAEPGPARTRRHPGGAAMAPALAPSCDAIGGRGAARLAAVALRSFYAIAILRSRRRLPC